MGLEAVAAQDPRLGALDFIAKSLYMRKGGVPSPSC